MKNNKSEPIPVMDYRQYRRARRLVHECCNYIDGNCIALDDGEECGSKFGQFYIDAIPYLGDIRLFIAEDTEKIVFHRSEEVINFWRENCIGDVTVIMIPGNHLTCFTDVNNIQKLVNMITEK